MKLLSVIVRSARDVSYVSYFRNAKYYVAVRANTLAKGELINIIMARSNFQLSAIPSIALRPLGHLLILGANEIY